MLATDTAHAYSEAWWPTGHAIGYEHTFTHAFVELMDAFREDRTACPQF